MDILTPILEDVKEILGDLVEDVEALVGVAIDDILACDTGLLDVNGLANLLSELLHVCLFSVVFCYPG